MHYSLSWTGAFIPLRLLLLCNSCHDVDNCKVASIFKSSHWGIFIRRRQRQRPENCTRVIAQNTLFSPSHFSSLSLSLFSWTVLRPFVSLSLFSSLTQLLCIFSSLCMHDIVYFNLSQESILVATLMNVCKFKRVMPSSSQCDVILGKEREKFEDEKFLSLLSVFPLLSVTNGITELLCEKMRKSKPLGKVRDITHGLRSLHLRERQTEK